MKIGICSGYFQRFHNGHIDYIKTAVKCFDVVIVIINNDLQQRNKYKDFTDIKNVREIEEEIKLYFPSVIIKVSVDEDGTVCKTLHCLRKSYPDDVLFFCKDGDRNIRNIPEKESLEQLHIIFRQFTNIKKDSSSKIMAGEVKNEGC